MRKMSTASSRLKNFKRLQERKEWLALGEKAFAKVWDNPKDEETWSKYI